MQKLSKKLVSKIFGEFDCYVSKEVSPKDIELYYQWSIAIITSLSSGEDEDGGEHENAICFIKQTLLNLEPPIGRDKLYDPSIDIGSQEWTIRVQYKTDITFEYKITKDLLLTVYRNNCPVWKAECLRWEERMYKPLIDALENTCDTLINISEYSRKN